MELNQSKTAYVLEGQEFPRVTTILEEAGVINTGFFTEYHATRGTYVHEATEFYDRGTLDMNSVKGDIIPFVEGYIKFRKEVPMKMEWIEFPVVHRGLKYGTRLDRVVTLGGRKGVLDIKCTKVKPAYVGQQTMAHKLAYNFTVAMDPRDRIQDRFALLLPGDGKYQIKPLTDDNDLPAWIKTLRRFYDGKNT